MKIAYRAQNLIDAQLIKDQLAYANIDSQIQGEFLQGGIGELPAMGLVNIMVADQDLEPARRIVMQWEQDHLGTTPNEVITQSRDPIAILLVVAVILCAVVLLLNP